MNIWELTLIPLLTFIYWINLPIDIMKPTHQTKFSYIHNTFIQMLGWSTRVCLYVCVCVCGVRRVWGIPCSFFHDSHMINPHPGQLNLARQIRCMDLMAPHLSERRKNKNKFFSRNQICEEISSKSLQRIRLFYFCFFFSLNQICEEISQKHFKGKIIISFFMKSILWRNFLKIISKEK